MVEKATFSNYPLKKNDLIRFISGGGGGYGNPLERDPEMVLDDVLNEYITADEARYVYGVVLIEDNGTLSVDGEGTSALRGKMAVEQRRH